MAQHLQSQMKTECEPCVLEKTAVWTETGTQDVFVAGRRAPSQPTLRILGTTLGADRVEVRIAAAWRAFWSQKEWFLSRSLPLKMWWARRKQRLAPALVFGSWSCTWSDKIIHRIFTETHHMVRLLFHRRKNEESWVEWHVSSPRRSPDWIQQMVGAPWAHRMLGQCSNIWIAWT